jgi:hypothetical protein
MYRRPVAGTAGLLAAALALTSLDCLAAQVARRTSSPTSAVRVMAGSARGVSATTSLSPEQKLSVLQDALGPVPDAAALSTPVLLTVTQPSHADRIYVSTQSTDAHSFPKEDVRWTLHPRLGSNMVVLVTRGVMTKPVLVDCAVSAQGGAAGVARLQVDKGKGGTLSVITVKGSNQHLATVLLPSDAGDDVAAVGIKVLENSPGGLEVHRCEVTAMQ